GLAREARADPRRGWNRLEEVRISRASAEQRAGRAGRTQPGRCLRLWTIAEHAERREREAPEVLRLDLSAAVLELRAWGVGDLRSFAWLDAPRDGALEAAERLLSALGAVAADGALTDVGRRMLDLPAPPRLARMLVEAEREGAAEEGALAAALAAERDILLERRAFAEGDAARWPTGRSDLWLRMELFHRASNAHDLDPRAVRAVERARRQLARSLDRRGARGAGEDAILRSVLAGFSDRVVRRREPGSTRGVMVGGGGVALDPASVVREAELFVAVDLDAGPRRERFEARVAMASAVERRWLEEMFPERIRTLREVVFDAASERIVARERELYADLALRETNRHDVDPLLAATMLAEEAKRDPARALSIGRDERAFLDRVWFLARTMPELGMPDSEGEPLARAIDVLSAGKRSFAELRAADLVGALRAALSPRRLQALERHAPECFRLPSGRSARITYGREKPPVAAARIQDLFGLAATPRVAAGRVPLVIEILAPNNRPVQVTDDLGSFWRRTYPEVRKQLRGRYPKHAWPESPLDATLDSSRDRR
ncbi:MAG TPA: ATP-dependent helicase C-terminal domain-containing protein, partial [Candidatus Binatia bacterium]|nr:ATP-dependent helicase C-terminal domain-containing protein [Candidatus Binatia bacterium]